MKYESSLQNLAFAVVITAQLTYLNFRLKGKINFTTQLYEGIKYFNSKLSLWMPQLSSEKLILFPKCKELKNGTNPGIVVKEYSWTNSWFLIFWTSVCIILTIIHLLCCSGRREYANGTFINTVNFFTQSKIFWSGDSWFLFITSWKL